jgi:two-component system, NarL family, sensor kinase
MLQISKMKRILFNTFLVLIASQTFAQLNLVQIDKLNDSANVLLKSDPQRALRIAQYAMKQGEKFESSKSLAESVRLVGHAYSALEEMDKVVNFLMPLLKKYEGKNDWLLAFGNHRIASAYLDRGEFDVCIRHALEAKKLFEKLKDYGNLANTTTLVGKVFLRQNNYKQALKYMDEAITYANLEPKKNFLANIYSAKAIVLAEHQELDSACAYFEKTIAIREALKDSVTLSWDYNDLASMYIYMNQTDKSIFYFEKAKALFNRFGNKDGLSTLHSNLGAMYLGKKDFTKAKINFDLASSLIDKKQDAELYHDLLKNYFSFYKMSGQCQKANLFADSLFSFKDSLANKSMDKTVAEMNVKYESEKKALNIVALKKEKKLMSFIYAALLATLGLVGFAVYSRLKSKKEKEMNQLIIYEKEERTRSIIEAEETERVRIARELHDGVGQTMVAANMNLEALKDEANANLIANKNYASSLQLVQAAISELRIISHSMIPSVLLKHGLSSALNDFVMLMKQTNKLTIELDIAGIEQRLPIMIESTMYRIIQETMSNVLKHASANLVSISLVKDGNQLELLITDNGKGFDIENVKHKNGIGLKNIISRVDYLKGEIDINSSQQNGTSIFIEVPIVIG